MAADRQPTPPATLQDLIDHLTAGDADPLPESETWGDTMNRIHVPDRVHRITEEVFVQFLELLPPRWMHAQYLAFAEGQEPLQLFWLRKRVTALPAEYFTRRLTELEVEQFCELTGVPQNYGDYYGSDF